MVDECPSVVAEIQTTPQNGLRLPMIDENVPFERLTSGTHTDISPASLSSICLAQSIFSNHVPSNLPENVFALQSSKVYLMRFKF